MLSKKRKTNIDMTALATEFRNRHYSYFVATEDIVRALGDLVKLLDQRDKCAAASVLVALAHALTELPPIDPKYESGENGIVP